MRTSSNDRYTEPIADPLKLKSAAAKSHPSLIDLLEGNVPSVNPLWMITGGLAAFMLLLVVVW